MQACGWTVSFADLTLGERVGTVLDEHKRLSDRFRGIRHAAGWDPSDEVRNSHTDPPRSLYLSDEFREGFQELANRQMTFDAWLYHHQISELTDLAQTFPEVTIVFDHFGGPLGIGPYKGLSDEIFDQWVIDVGELSKCENVYAKLGGIVMPINGFGWHNKMMCPPPLMKLFLKPAVIIKRRLNCSVRIGACLRVIFLWINRAALMWSCGTHLRKLLNHLQKKTSGICFTTPRFVRTSSNLAVML